MTAHPENLISDRKASIRKSHSFCSLETKSQIGKYSHSTGAIHNIRNKSNELVTGQIYSLTKYIYFMVDKQDFCGQTELQKESKADFLVR